MKKVRVPITGARPEYSRKRPIVPDAKDTSAQEQTMIAEAPSPFKNNQQVPQIPAGTNPLYRANPQFHKDAQKFGGAGRRTGVANTSQTNYGASGDQKPGGYRSNPLITGNPTRGGKRVAGDGNQPLAKGIKTRSGKMRTNLDIFNPRTLHEAGLTKL